MSKLLTRFLDGTTVPLRIACLGFAIAFCGAVFAFSIDYGPQNRLSYIAFGMGVVGVGTGFLGVALGWLTALRRLGSDGAPEAPTRQAAVASPAPESAAVLSGPGGIEPPMR